MKRFFSFVLCIVFVLSLAACGESKAKSDHGVDIEKFAKSGQIEGIDFKLGDSVDSTKKALEETKDDHGDSMYFDYTSGEYTIMSNGAVYCCYETDDKKEGLTHIVSSDTFYGFTIGDVSTAVRDTMAEMGYTAKERDAKSGEIFFLPGGNFTVLEYEISDNTVLFVFQEHALCAAVIKDD